MLYHRELLNIFIIYYNALLLPIVYARSIKPPTGYTRLRSVYQPIYPEAYYGQQVYPYQMPYAYGYQAPPPPIYTPYGAYYDRNYGIYKPFPGGGFPLRIDYKNRCPGNSMGIKPHPRQQEYYYVCQPNCVIFSKCQNYETFNPTSGHCAEPPSYDATSFCIEPGQFPYFNDCKVFYRCDENLQPQFYRCNRDKIYSADVRQCVPGKQCPPTEISHNSTALPENCENKFPPCLQNGTFRSNVDCSLYYTCQRNENGSFLQTRFKCSGDNYFDIITKTCVSPNRVECGQMPIAKLIYPGYPAYSRTFEQDISEDCSGVTTCESNNTEPKLVGSKRVDEHSDEEVGIPSLELNIPTNNSKSLMIKKTEASSFPRNFLDCIKNLSTLPGTPPLINVSTDSSTLNTTLTTVKASTKPANSRIDIMITTTKPNVSDKTSSITVPIASTRADTNIATDSSTKSSATSSIFKTGTKLFTQNSNITPAITRFYESSTQNRSAIKTSIEINRENTSESTEMSSKTPEVLRTTRILTKIPAEYSTLSPVVLNGSLANSSTIISVASVLQRFSTLSTDLSFETTPNSATSSSNISTENQNPTPEYSTEPSILNSTAISITSEPYDYSTLSSSKNNLKTSTENQNEETFVTTEQSIATRPASTVRRPNTSTKTQTSTTALPTESSILSSTLMSTAPTIQNSPTLSSLIPDLTTSVKSHSEESPVTTQTSIYTTQASIANSPILSTEIPTSNTESSTLGSTVTSHVSPLQESSTLSSLTTDLITTMRSQNGESSVTTQTSTDTSQASIASSPVVSTGIETSTKELFRVTSALSSIVMSTASTLQESSTLSSSTTDLITPMRTHNEESSVTSQTFTDTSDALTKSSPSFSTEIPTSTLESSTLVSTVTSNVSPLQESSTLSYSLTDLPTSTKSQSGESSVTIQTHTDTSQASVASSPSVSTGIQTSTTEFSIAPSTLSNILISTASTPHESSTLSSSTMDLKTPMRTQNEESSVTPQSFTDTSEASIASSPSVSTEIPTSITESSNLGITVTLNVSPLHESSTLSSSTTDLIKSMRSQNGESSVTQTFTDTSEASIVSSPRFSTEIPFSITESSTLGITVTSNVSPLHESSTLSSSTTDLITTMRSQNRESSVTQTFTDTSEASIASSPSFSTEIPTSIMESSTLGITVTSNVSPLHESSTLNSSNTDLMTTMRSQNGESSVTTQTSTDTSQASIASSPIVSIGIETSTTEFLRATSALSSIVISTASTLQESSTLSSSTTDLITPMRTHNEESSVTSQTFTDTSDALITSSPSFSTEIPTSTMESSTLVSTITSNVSPLQESSTPSHSLTDLPTSTKSQNGESSVTIQRHIDTSQASVASSPSVSTGIQTSTTEFSIAPSTLSNILISTASTLKESSTLSNSRTDLTTPTERQSKEVSIGVSSTETSTEGSIIGSTTSISLEFSTPVNSITETTIENSTKPEITTDSSRANNFIISTDFSKESVTSNLLTKISTENNSIETTKKSVFDKSSEISDIINGGTTSQDSASPSETNNSETTSPQQSTQKSTIGDSIASTSIATLISARTITKPTALINTGTSSTQALPSTTKVPKTSDCKTLDGKCKPHTKVHQTNSTLETNEDYVDEIQILDNEIVIDSKFSSVKTTTERITLKDEEMSSSSSAEIDSNSSEFENINGKFISKAANCIQTSISCNRTTATTTTPITSVTQPLKVAAIHEENISQIQSSETHESEVINQNNSNKIDVNFQNKHTFSLKSHNKFANIQPNTIATPLHVVQIENIDTSASSSSQGLEHKNKNHKILKSTQSTELKFKITPNIISSKKMPITLSRMSLIDLNADSQSGPFTSSSSEIDSLALKEQLKSTIAMESKEFNKIIKTKFLPIISPTTNTLSFETVINGNNSQNESSELEISENDSIDTTSIKRSSELNTLINESKFPIKSIKAISARSETSRKSTEPKLVPTTNPNITATTTQTPLNIIKLKNVEDIESESEADSSSQSISLETTNIEDSSSTTNPAVNNIAVTKFKASPRIQSLTIVNSDQLDESTENGRSSSKLSEFTEITNKQDNTTPNIKNNIVKKRKSPSFSSQGEIPITIANLTKKPLIGTETITDDNSNFSSISSESMEFASVTQTFVDNNRTLLTIPVSPVKAETSTPTITTLSVIVEPNPNEDESSSLNNFFECEEVKSTTLPTTDITRILKMNSAIVHKTSTVSPKTKSGFNGEKKKVRFLNDSLKPIAVKRLSSGRKNHINSPVNATLKEVKSIAGYTKNHSSVLPHITTLLAESTERKLNNTSVILNNSIQSGKTKQSERIVAGTIRNQMVSSPKFTQNFAEDIKFISNEEDKSSSFNNFSESEHVDLTTKSVENVTKSQALNTTLPPNIPALVANIARNKDPLKILKHAYNEDSFSSSSGSCETEEVISTNKCVENTTKSQIANIKVSSTIPVLSTKRETSSLNKDLLKIVETVENTTKSQVSNHNLPSEISVLSSTKTTFPPSLNPLRIVKTDTNEDVFSSSSDSWKFNEVLLTNKSVGNATKSQILSTIVSSTIPVLPSKRPMSTPIIKLLHTSNESSFSSSSGSWESEEVVSVERTTKSQIKITTLPPKISKLPATTAAKKILKTIKNASERSFSSSSSSWESEEVITTNKYIENTTMPQISRTTASSSIITELPVKRNTSLSNKNLLNIAEITKNKTKPQDSHPILSSTIVLSTKTTTIPPAINPQKIIEAASNENSFSSSSDLWESEEVISINKSMENITNPQITATTLPFTIPLMSIETTTSIMTKDPLKIVKPNSNESRFSSSRDSWESEEVILSNKSVNNTTKSQIPSTTVSSIVTMLPTRRKTSTPNKDLLKIVETVENTTKSLVSSHNLPSIISVLSTKTTTPLPVINPLKIIETTSNENSLSLSSDSFESEEAISTKKSVGNKTKSQISSTTIPVLRTTTSAQIADLLKFDETISNGKSVSNGIIDLEEIRSTSKSAEDIIKSQISNSTTSRTSSFSESKESSTLAASLIRTASVKVELLSDENDDSSSPNSLANSKEVEFTTEMIMRDTKAHTQTTSTSPIIALLSTRMITTSPIPYQSIASSHKASSIEVKTQPAIAISIPTKIQIKNPVVAPKPILNRLTSISLSEGITVPKINTLPINTTPPLSQVPTVPSVEDVGHSTVAPSISIDTGAVENNTETKDIFKILPNSSDSQNDTYKHFTLNSTQLDVRIINDSIILRNISNKRRSDPVINYITNSSTASTTSKCDRETVPELVLKIYEPIDLRILYCPRNCEQQHKHKFDPNTNTKPIEQDLSAYNKHTPECQHSHEHTVDVEWKPKQISDTARFQIIKPKFLGKLTAA